MNHVYHTGQFALEHASLRAALAVLTLLPAVDCQLEPMDSEANVLRTRLSGSHACLNRSLPICHAVKLIAQALKVPRRGDCLLCLSPL